MECLFAPVVNWLVCIYFVLLWKNTAVTGATKAPDLTVIDNFIIYATSD
jgi:hypothetical protein